MHLIVNCPSDLELLSKQYFDYFHPQLQKHWAYKDFNFISHFIAQFSVRRIIFQKDADNFEIEHKTCKGGTAPPTKNKHPLWA